MRLATEKRRNLARGQHRVWCQGLASGAFAEGFPVGCGVPLENGWDQEYEALWSSPLPASMPPIEMLLHSMRLRVGALLIFASVGAAADEPVPAAFPKGRYDSLRGHSPFALATTEPPPAPATAAFAANWFVSGIARVGEDDFVTIKSRDLTTQFSLFGKNDSSAEGVTLVSVTWSDVVAKSTVVLRKGGETARLEFNEAQLRATPAASAPAVSPAPNGGQPMANNATQRAGNVLPPNSSTIGNPGQMVAPASNLSGRRRPQVIQPPVGH